MHVVTLATSNPSIRCLMAHSFNVDVGVGVYVDLLRVQLLGPSIVSISHDSFHGISSHSHPRNSPRTPPPSPPLSPFCQSPPSSNSTLPYYPSSSCRPHSSLPYSSPHLPTRIHPLLRFVTVTSTMNDFYARRN
ncbi:hypothetical protein EGR_10975 [Echinococcus granulosus]|uniref:Uncharacterized protein n=1 Tax=Echinococcus granulosus TaxID=6210 RepID=W6TZD3_ECHGR|nr:hypothetical protein EGR_10975 [Echinococcus granulosus]EUB54165.1 hypothetical protein EGR_10975 [Echinococcus granulosus]